MALADRTISYFRAHRAIVTGEPGVSHHAMTTDSAPLRSVVRGFHVSISKPLHRWWVKLVGFISVSAFLSLMNFLQGADLFVKK